MVNTKSRACDSCYKRKIRCDAAERGGICEWCQEHEFECTFTRKKRRTGPKTASAADNDANGSQIQTLGDLMASTSLPKEEAPALSTTSTPGSRTSTSSVCSVCRPRLAGPVTGQTLGRMHIFGETFGVNCSRNGLPHLTSKCEEWIFSRTGRWPRFQHIYGEAENHPRNTIDSMRSSTFADSRADLPPLLVVQSLFAQYINSDYSMVFPVVDRILFEETIQVAYSPHSDTDSDEYLCAKACVFAFVAMANSQFPPPSGILKLTSDQYIKEAQILLADVMENTSLAALQTCFMILQYQCLCGQFQASSKYHSIACRLIFALGGHTTSFPRPKDRALTLREREDRQLRLLFWLCYCFDKDIALRTGQPPIIDDSFCNLELPEGYLETHFNMQQKSIADDMATPCLIGDLRLSIIKSKAIRTLYSVSASQKTDAELIRSIRELDEDLENWRVSVPEAFAPALSIRKDVAHADALRQGSRSMLHIELHLDYLHLLNTIHWASGRCFVSSDAGMSFGVKSSLDLTTEASRSIIIYLSSAAHRLVGEAFWVFIFYPVTALMALFFSILHYPHEPDAAQDLQLLRKVSEIIRSMPVPRLTIAEVEYLGKMDIFVAELSRLAEHAIQKAQEIQM